MQVQGRERQVKIVISNFQFLQQLSIDLLAGSILCWCGVPTIYLPLRGV